MRVAIATRPWARVAWERTKSLADAAIATAPQPAPSASVDYSVDGRVGGKCDPVNPSGWLCLLYARGLRDGQHALALAQAFAVTGDTTYARKAKEYLLAWARTYSTPNPTVSQAIAEPGGFMLKGLIAYDLVRSTFSTMERAEMARWARPFVGRGKRLADGQRDDPRSPDNTFNGDTSNWQSFGNSAAFSRSLAVAAATAVSDTEVRRALDWNWHHVTSKGAAYGWPELIDGQIIDGTGGETFEGRARNDIGYGLLASVPLLLIAHVAKHAGYGPNLFSYVTEHGNSVMSPFVYYGRYISFTASWPPADGSFGNSANVASRFRAALDNNVADAPRSVSKALRRVVSYGGPGQRGANFDPYIWLFGALRASA